MDGLWMTLKTIVSRFIRVSRLLGPFNAQNMAIWIKPENAIGHILTMFWRVKYRSMKRFNSFEKIEVFQVLFNLRT